MDGCLSRDGFDWMGKSLRFFHAVSAASAEAPQRVISLSPSMTEIRFALGLEDRVVGVTDFCDYPEEAKRKPKIGSYVSPNLEVIFALNPQLVVAVPTVANRPLLERFSQLGIKVLGREIRDLKGIWFIIEVVGQAADAQARADKLVGEMRKRADRVRKLILESPRSGSTLWLAMIPL